MEPEKITEHFMVLGHRVNFNTLPGKFYLSSVYFTVTRVETNKPFPIFEKIRHFAKLSSFSFANFRESENKFSSQPYF